MFSLMPQINVVCTPLVDVRPEIITTAVMETPKTDYTNRQVSHMQSAIILNITDCNVRAHPEHFTHTVILKPLSRDSEVMEPRADLTSKQSWPTSTPRSQGEILLAQVFSLHNVM